MSISPEGRKVSILFNFKKSIKEGFLLVLTAALFANNAMVPETVPKLVKITLKYKNDNFQELN